MTALPRPTLARDGDPGARVTASLAASALGVYLLVALGAATSLLDGAAVCPTWPACRGVPADPLADPALAAAWTHRAAALVVGLLLLGTTVRARRHATPRVGYATAAAAALYPGQVALGAVAATTGAPLPLAAAHLVVGMAIFSSVLVGLLWQLEARTPTEPCLPAGGDDATPDAVARNDATPDTAGGAPTAAAAEPPDTAGGVPTEAAPEPPAAAGEGSTAAVAEPADVADGEPTTTIDRGLRARAGAYLELTKPRLMWLLCLVALAAMGLAAGPALAPGTAAATLLGGVLAIGASGTFNNVLERDVDRKMGRTNERPLVEGRIPVRRALAFGVALSLASVVTFLAFVNALAAALGLLAILFYSVVYTVVLKPNTSQNIVIGGAVGAFPALIGWAAVTNTVGLPALVLGAVIFLWTPAHFYNLALAYKDDYARGGFPMLPVVRGEAITRRHVLLYFGATMLGAVVLGATTRLDVLYAATTTVLGGVFLVALVDQYRDRTEAAAFRTFHASNAYLGALLLAVTVDALLI